LIEIELAGVITTQVTLLPVLRRTWAVAHGEQAPDAPPGVVVAWRDDRPKRAHRRTQPGDQAAPLTEQQFHDEQARGRDRRRARLLVNRRRRGCL
jgi:hypothetical protein